MRTVRAGFIAVVLGTAATSGIAACGKSADVALARAGDAAAPKDTAAAPKDMAGPAPDASAPDATTPTTDGPPVVDLGFAPLDTAGPTATPETFAGDWTYDTGLAQLICPGQNPLKEQLDGAFITFELGASVAPLILTAPGCNLRFDIKGQSAVIQPGQTCKNPIAGRAATSAPMVFSFTLQGPGAHQTFSWTVTFADEPGAPCTMSGEGTMSRKPKV